MSGRKGEIRWPGLDGFVLDLWVIYAIMSVLSCLRDMVADVMSSRKSGQKQESVKQKRQKDRDRHDNWRDY